MTTEAINIPDQDADIDQMVAKLHSDLKFYLGIQTELMRRQYGSREAVSLPQNVDDWEEYSVEFSQAFDEVIAEELKKDPGSLEYLKSNPADVIEKISQKIKLFHEIEIKLIEQIDIMGKVPKGFREWHKDFAETLMKIFHDDKEIYNKYIASMDNASQEDVLRELEDRLYTSQ